MHRLVVARQSGGPCCAPMERVAVAQPRPESSPSADLRPAPRLAALRPHSRSKRCCTRRCEAHPKKLQSVDPFLGAPPKDLSRVAALTGDTCKHTFKSKRAGWHIYKQTNASRAQPVVLGSAPPCGGTPEWWPVLCAHGARGLRALRCAARISAPWSRLHSRARRALQALTCAQRPAWQHSDRTRGPNAVAPDAARRTRRDSKALT